MTFWTTFFSTALLGFAVALFGAGLFGAYYGKGRSRSIGFLLSLVALLLVGLFAALTWDLVPAIQPIFNPDHVAEAMTAVLAAALGAAAAIFLFVRAITRG